MLSATVVRRLIGDAEISVVATMAPHGHNIEEMHFRGVLSSILNTPYFSFLQTVASHLYESTLC